MDATVKGWRHADSCRALVKSMCKKAISQKGYIVERREVDGDGQWTRATYNNVPDTRMKVTGLTPKKKYEFRVAAVNIAGQGTLREHLNLNFSLYTGPYSQNSEQIIARRAPCIPKIDLNMLVRNVLAFQGEPASLYVPFFASPEPEITWLKTEKTVR